MSEITRRQMCAGLSALAAMGGVLEAQATTAGGAGGKALSESRVFTIEEMPVRKMANGGESRDVLRGTLTTGEVVAVHESEQAARAAPNPLHTIKHTEVIVVLEGTVAFEHDGKSEKAGPGSVILVVPGAMHAVRNGGAGTVKYCVVQVGGDTKG